MTNFLKDQWKAGALAGSTPEEAFRLIYYDFWSHPQVSQNDWASAFEEVFSIKVEAFYEILQNYPNDVSKVLPSDDIKLGNIF